jgi:hypothetical protein
MANRLCSPPQGTRHRHHAELIDIASTHSAQPSTPVRVRSPTALFLREGSRQARSRLQVAAFQGLFT